MSKFLIADCDYIQGHLRYGHYELNITDEEYEEYNNLSSEEQVGYFRDNADLIVDDYTIDDAARPTNIRLDIVPEGSLGSLTGTLIN